MEEQKFMVSGQEEVIKEKKIKEMKLPLKGTKFMIMGQEYIVTYVNEGKKRFTAEPCDGMY
jgi:hypothetical protein